MFSSSTGGKGFRRKAMSEAVPSPGPVYPPMAPPNPTFIGHQAHRNHSLADLLEPSVDGPPSPEQLRALSRSVKHRSQLTSSSGSSSLLSSTSDRRQSWDRSLENIGISRNPSQRSSSRDRPDSVQLFGKAIFHRRGKLRRGSSDQSASNNGSLLSAAEIPMEVAKDQHFIQSMFTRRRTLRPGDPEPSQKKLQISGPYNFQHLTHTQKDALPDLEHTNRMELVSEFSNLRLRRGTEPCLPGIPPEGLHFANFSSEALNAQDTSSGTNASSNAESALPGRHSRADSRQKMLPPTPSSPKWFTKPSQSQDKASLSPPRSPRSRNDSSQVSPIPPPPRTSSRVSMRHDGCDPLSTTSLDRPMTGGSFRQPSPFILPIPEGMRPLPMPPPEETIAEGERFAHAISTADDAAWPLRNGMGPLPEVPEEDEIHIVRQTQSSMSNHSSLRGSVSVPLLRQMSLAQADQRAPSNASDTLGRFDLFAAQRALHDTADEYRADDYMRESWEDDIDYCYEHAAEADFDYAWERPSCDVGRLDRGDFLTGPHFNTMGSLRAIPTRMLSPSVPEVPALSPASQTSNLTQHEVITPTIVPAPVASNFSLPRRKSSVQLHRDPDLSYSPCSSVKDIQEFKLSPSLLIPNDYHQQMLQYEREGQQDHELDDEYEERFMKFGKSLSVSQARSSTSTMDSRLSGHSMASSRHKSSASTSTAFTRWTGSSTSSWQVNGDAFQATIAKAISDESQIIGQPSMVTLPESEETFGPPTRQDSGRHVRAHSEANLLMKATPDTTMPVENKPAKLPLKTRRRARTTSRSHNNPPPQFALFPQIPPTRL
ncbi:hypothetical protein F5X96DRAFT_514168 [Biscogniauxia mediterranea]|nr:hypothetical protein F5X96DRAFT_514168 [Biscogniauxia mediterranea]